MQVGKCATPGLYPDGGGLYLQVTTGANGSPRKSWLFRFSLHGRARHMGLGSFKYVSLAYARAARDKARAKIIAGVPIEVRGFHSPPSAPVMPVDECSSAYIKAHSTAWRNARHRAQWTSTLAAYASPVFGALPVDN